MQWQTSDFSTTCTLATHGAAVFTAQQQQVSGMLVASQAMWNYSWLVSNGSLIPTWDLTQKGPHGWFQLQCFGLFQGTTILHREANKTAGEMSVFLMKLCIICLWIVQNICYLVVFDPISITYVHKSRQHPQSGSSRAPQCRSWCSSAESAPLQSTAHHPARWLQCLGERLFLELPGNHSERTPVVCRLPWHLQSSTGHHTQSPIVHCNTAPLSPPAHCVRPPASMFH